MQSTHHAETPAAVIGCDEVIKLQVGEWPEGVKLNPYVRYCERNSWTDLRTMRRADGTTYVQIRECSRWGALYAIGEWEGEYATAMDVACRARVA